MASSVLSVFETYQKARVAFVQSVADLATRAQNIEIMQNAGVMQLLRPLLLDNVPSIQQSSALALGRLANYSDDLAEAVGEISLELGILKKRAQVYPIRSKEYPTPAKRPKYSLLDCMKTSEILNLKPNHWRKNLREILTDYRELNSR